jgi:hypothetical protein
MIFHCLKFETLQHGGPGTHGMGGPSYTPRHWVPFSASSYDSQDYGGGILARLHRGATELGCELPPIHIVPHCCIAWLSFELRREHLATAAVKESLLSNGWCITVVPWSLPSTG